MKTMTCSQLGGPTSCNHQYHANTFEEIAQQSKQHGMDMAQKKDQAHLEAMQAMKTKMTNPKAMQQWMEQKKKQFNTLPNND